MFYKTITWFGTNFGKDATEHWFLDNAKQLIKSYLLAVNRVNEYRKSSGSTVD